MDWFIVHYPWSFPSDEWHIIQLNVNVVSGHSSMPPRNYFSHRWLQSLSPCGAIRPKLVNQDPKRGVYLNESNKVKSTELFGGIFCRICWMCLAIIAWSLYAFELYSVPRKSNIGLIPTEREPVWHPMSHQTFCHQHIEAETKWPPLHTDDIFKLIFLMKMFKFRLKFHWSVPMVQLTIFKH